MTCEGCVLGTTAALLDCVEKASAAAPGAVASISSTKPLDLGNLFNNGNGVVAGESFIRFLIAANINM